jgi:hypothetical protein
VSLAGLDPAEPLEQARPVVYGFIAKLSNVGPWKTAQALTEDGRVLTTVTVSVGSRLTVGVLTSHVEREHPGLLDTCDFVWVDNLSTHPGALMACLAACDAREAVAL